MSVRFGFWTLLAVVLTGCVGGGDIKDSGPTRPVDMSHVPDAVPRAEVRTKAGNKSPYTVLGKTYTVLPSSQGYNEVGGASWYGKKFHGRRTSNGEVYDMYGMTAAHKSLPIPSYVRVTNLANGRQVVVRVNDRGPFHGGRIIDLTYAAASKLGFAQQGTAQVRVETVGPGDQPPQSVAVSPEPIQRPTVKLSPPESGKPVNTQPVYRLPANTYLQAGAFSSRQGAESVQQRISQLTSVPVTVTETVSDSLFRVRLGPVTDNQVIIRLRQLLAENQLPVPHVVYE
ncbi:septal ring lytic transglycosylase RlpA family protein [Candidatus Pelagadaptatus aseana]|uniref:septal ring lytic transglycosylase RlpA family protein n=1 Tax=Candidatus Pelagadaptatus aseana TaxID=3120508 RepID=UPI003C6F9EC5